MTGLSTSAMPSRSRLPLLSTNLFGELIVLNLLVHLPLSKNMSRIMVVDVGVGKEVEGKKGEVEGRILMKILAQPCQSRSTRAHNNLIGNGEVLSGAEKKSSFIFIILRLLCESWLELMRGRKCGRSEVGPRSSTSNGGLMYFSHVSSTHLPPLFPQHCTKNNFSTELTMEDFEKHIRKAIDQGDVANAVLEVRRKGTYFPGFIAPLQLLILRCRPLL